MKALQKLKKDWKAYLIGAVIYTVLVLVYSLADYHYNFDKSTVFFAGFMTFGVTDLAVEISKLFFNDIENNE